MGLTKLGKLVWSRIRDILDIVTCHLAVCKNGALRLILACNAKRTAEMVVGITAALLPLSIVFAPPARADAGVGMLMVMSVSLWAILLLLIVPLEAWIARTIFVLPFMTCLKISTLANLASTVAGILITWASLLCYEMFWYRDPNTYWIVPVNELLWCVPCFFASIWIEAIVAGKLVEARLQNSVHQWAVKANVASYSILVALLLGLLIWSVASEFAMRNSDDFCDVDRISAERVWRAQYNHMRDGTGRFRKRKTVGYHWQDDGKPKSWLKDEYIKSHEAYDPLSDDKAIAILEAAITKYDHETLTQKNAMPKDDVFCALSTLADCYDRQKQFAKSKGLRLRCLKLTCQDTEDLHLADDYAELGEFDSANKIYEKLAGRNDLYCQGHALIGLGNVAEKQKESVKAEAFFQKAKQLFFDNLDREGTECSEACVRLAEFYVAEKRFSDAESLLLQETRYRDDRGPKSSVGPWPIPEFLLALSDCYLAQGNYQKAERCIKLAMRGQSTSAPAQASKKYAEFLQKRGQTAEASIWSQRVKDTAALQGTIE